MWLIPTMNMCSLERGAWIGAAISLDEQGLCMCQCWCVCVCALVSNVSREQLNNFATASKNFPRQKQCVIKGTHTNSAVKQQQQQQQHISRTANLHIHTQTGLSLGQAMRGFGLYGIAILLLQHPQSVFFFVRVSVCVDECKCVCTKQERVRVWCYSGHFSVKETNTRVCVSAWLCLLLQLWIIFSSHVRGCQRQYHLPVPPIAFVLILRAETPPAHIAPNLLSPL